MNINFEMLKLRNFKSFIEADVVLDRNGFVLVNGINNNEVDCSKSNGVGKSSIFDGVVWALTGLTMQKSKQVENLYAPEKSKTEAELTFTFDDHSFVVSRTKNPSNLKIYVDGEDKSGKGIRDTEKILEEYLGDINFNLISSVIILGQGLPNKFSNNSPSGRKDTLEVLANADFMIQDLKRRVGERKEYLNSEYTQKRDDVLAKQTSISIWQEELEHRREELASLKTEDIAELQMQREQADFEVLQLLDELESLEDEMEETSEMIDNYQAVVQEITADRERLLSEFVPSIDVDAIKEKKVRKDAEQHQARSELNKLTSIKDVCPTCGQKLEGVEIPKDEITRLQLAVDNLTVESLNLKAQIDEAIYRNGEERDELLHYKRDEIDINTAAIADLRKGLNEMTQKQKRLEALKNQREYEALDLKFQVENHQNKMNELKTQIEELLDKIATTTVDISNTNGEIAELTARTDIINKMTTVLKRDFRGYLLTNIVEYIDERAKEYCQDVFDNKNLSLEINGNDIDIKFDGKDYEILSGGEKQKVDIIIQLSLRDMLCTFLNFSSNILVIDELLDNVDSIGAAKVFNLIATKLNDVGCVYLISHHTDFDIPADDEINIVKGNDRISRIV